MYLIQKVTVLLLLLILSPILLLLAVLVKLNLGSPIVFRQDRPGKDGIIFTIIKFRTMLDSVNSKGDLLSDEDRLTKFGQFLRSTSLDELPELYNVVKGEMNLVGPRPLLIEYLPLYNNRQARRHEILPGITGWAQVNGRNEISWEDRLEMDVWYVENHSLWLDIKILFLTVFKVFKRDGINQAGHATMPYFSRTKTKTNND
jgi:lipopolysaccharide/colanic/teichoic acid biosynthesis glycosyltransferase